MQWLLGRKRKTLIESGLLQGMTDWHSHILPGVDDGVQTMGEALEILKLYEQLGVKEVWLTPHIMEDIPNTTNSLRDRFEELERAYNGAIILRLSAENMLDNLFAERFATGDVLPIGNKSDCLLVETSYFNPPTNLWQLLEIIKSRGYHPVLAHPERYFYMNDKDYEHLKEGGVLFQLNMLSLTGLYGKPVLKKAHKLIRKGFYNLIGSDIHSLLVYQNQSNIKIDDDTLVNIQHLSHI